MPDEFTFFDLQVNGYLGVDFNSDELSLDTLSSACEQLHIGGVGGILATIITDDIDLMSHRVKNIVAARTKSSSIHNMIAGIHLEGPFINAAEGFVGAHSTEAVRPACIESMQHLFEAGGGMIRLVTLAPECDAGSRVTRWLVDRGVTVSAGHCNPSIDELSAAIDNGLSMFTHLGNGCPLYLNRHDNIIQRALALADRLWACFIVDGIHVPYVALRNYIKHFGVERSIVVSDAIAAAGLGPGEYSLGRQVVVVDESLATWSSDRSHLAGSAMTMSQAFANLRSHVGLSETECRWLTGENPRTAIGLR